MNQQSESPTKAVFALAGGHGQDANWVNIRTQSAVSAVPDALTRQPLAPAHSRQLAASLSPIPNQDELPNELLNQPERFANRLQLLLKALPGGVVVLDANGRVEECNPAANHILGHALLGGVWRDIVVRIVSPQANDELDVTLHNGRRVNITTCSLGTEPGQILLIHDVTEKRDLQMKLDSVKRLCELGEMVAALAHQIRTPLAGALLHASNLQSYPHECERLAPRLVERLRSLDELVNSMLSFARNGSLAVSRISVPGLLDDFSRCMEGVESRVTSAFEIGQFPSGLSILGNPEALCSVFQNLVNNACQALHDGPLTLCARAELDQDELVVTLSDDGPGISTDLAERIFDPFVTTRSDGVGLGLAIARRIIESHGGSLDLQRSAVPGATFIIRLPSTREAQVERTPVDSNGVAR